MILDRGNSQGCRLAAALVAAGVCVSAIAAPATRPATPPAATPPAATTRPATRPASTSTLGHLPLQKSADQTPATRPADLAPHASPGLGAPRVAASLALVLGLIFALRWIVKRTAGPSMAAGGSAVVQVLNRSMISPRQHLVLLRVGRRLIVTADCNGQLTSLSEITDPDEVAALVGHLRDEKLAAAGKAFGGLLGRFRNTMSGDPDPDDEPAPRPRREMEDDGADCQEPGLAAARQDVSDLLERVRTMSHQFKSEV